MDKLFDSLPKFVIIDDIIYNINYYQVEDDKEILNGWWFCVYTKDENSLPPEIKTNGFIEFLCSSGPTLEQTYEDIYRKLKESGLYEKFK